QGTNQEIVLLQTKNIAQGYSALLAFDKSLDLVQNKTIMEETIKNIQIQSDDFEIASEQLEEKYESEEMQWQGSFQIEDILGNKIEFNFT
ncbi:hypothetical protein ACMUE1_00735, partial [Candidatus Phytoplasma asteris]